MKIRFLILVCIFCVGFAITNTAQITVNLDDLEYTDGQNYKMYGRNTLYIVQSYTGKIGGPYTWDFSTGPTDLDYTFDYVLPSTTPCNTDFPLAAIAEKRTGDGSEAFMFLDFQSGTGRVNYGVCQPGVIEPPYIFTPPITDFEDTIDFMDFWSGQTSFAAISAGIDLTVDYSFTAFCNAYGSLTLPNGLGSFPCLQVNYLEHYEYYFLGTPIQESYIRSFYWIIENAGIAVIISSEEGASIPPEDFAYSSQFSRMYESSKLTVSDEFSLDLKIFLEGPYNQSTELMNTSLNPTLIPLAQPYNIPPWNYVGTESVPSLPSTDIIDWVLVELRDTTQASLATENTIISRQAAFLLNNGSVVGLDGSGMLNFDIPVVNDLFALVWHRNHMGVLSADPLTGFNKIYNYDFTTGGEKAYGGTDAQKEINPGIWGMISGDGNADGVISALDKDNFWDNFVGLKGYLSSDFDLNSQVTNQDKNDFWVPNVGSASIIPQ